MTTKHENDTPFMLTGPLLEALLTSFEDRSIEQHEIIRNGTQKCKTRGFSYDDKTYEIKIEIPDMGYRDKLEVHLKRTENIHRTVENAVGSAELAKRAIAAIIEAGYRIDDSLVPIGRK